MKASLRLLFLLLMISAGVSAQTGPRKAYAVGDTLIGYTAEGEAFKAKVINVNSKTASLGVGGFDSCMVAGNFKPDRGTLTFPDSVEGFKITSVAQYALRFVVCDTLRLPGQITSIGTYACSSARIRSGRITWPAKLNTINAVAFASSTLKEVVLPNSILVLGNSVFSSNYSLKRVVLNTAVINFGSTMFNGCESLTEVVIPEGLKRLGQTAFQNCTALEEVTLPKSLTTIGSQVFRNCSALKRVNWAEGSTTIGEQMFANCTGLQEITIPATITTLGKNTFIGCTGLKTVNWDGLTLGAANMFENCTGLEEITIPASMQIKQDNTDSYMFKGCTGLKTVHMEGCEKIGQYMFDGCTGLETFHIPASLTSIGSYAFRGCRNLKELTYAEGFQITHYSSHAFTGCGFEEVTIPEGITSLDANVFENNVDLREVTLPTTLTGTGASSFTGSNRISTVRSLKPTPPSCNATSFSHIYTTAMLLVPMGAAPAYRAATNWKEFAKIEEEYDLPDGTAFEGLTPQGDTIRAIVLSNADRTCIIGDGTNPAAIKDINGALYLPTKCNVYDVVGIAAHAFKNQTGITMVKIPEGVQTIGDEAFKGCTGLKKVVTPSSLTGYGNDVFAGCTAIEDYTAQTETPLAINDGFFEASIFPTAVLYAPIGKVADYRAANVWKQFRTVTEQLNEGQRFLAALPEGMQACFTVVNNDTHTCRWTNRQSMSYPSIDYTESGEITIPEKIVGWTVIGVGDQVLYKHEGITRVTLPETVKSIGQGAFLYANKLETVNLPEGITSLPMSVFSGCTALSYVKLPETLTSMAVNCFANTGLRKVTLPAAMTTIGNNVFAGCTQLTDITSHGNPPSPWIDIVSDYDAVKLHVDEGMIDAYKADTVWAKFTHIDELGSGVPVNDTYFPDATLRNKLSELYGDKITEEELADNPTLDLSNLGLTDLTGIGYLTNLRHLDISGNNLTKADLTENTALETLNCADNQLTTLSVNNLLLLRILHCENNKLAQLNLSGLRSLEELYANNNQLAAISVSGLIRLLTIDVSHNLLTSVNVNPCTALRHLIADNNKLTGVYTNGAQQLLTLRVAHNNLGAVTLTSNTQLTTLDVADNRLRTIAVNNTPLLEHLNVSDNQLRGVQTTLLKQLKEFYGSNNNFFALDFSNTRQLEAINIDGNEMSYVDLLPCTKLTDATRVVLGTQQARGNGIYFNTEREMGAAMHPLALANDVENIVCDGNTISKGRARNYEGTAYLLFAPDPDGEGYDGKTFTYQYNPEISQLPDVRMNVTFTLSTVATGIEDINDNGNDNGHADGNWYTLDGQKLNAKPTQKGIYINSGKKVVVD